MSKFSVHETECKLYLAGYWYSVAAGAYYRMDDDEYFQVSRLQVNHATGISEEDLAEIERME